MGHVEELRRAQEFRCLQLVAPELRDATFDGVDVCWILVLDDGYRDAVDNEHHVGLVGLAGGRPQPPFPRDVQDVGPWLLVVDETDGPLTRLGLVVPLPLAPQPGEHLAIALDRRRQRL